MNWGEEERTTLRRMWSEGKSFQQIALKLGTTRSAVSGAVHRMRLEPRRVLQRAPMPEAKHPGEFRCCVECPGRKVARAACGPSVRKFSWEQA